MNLQELTLAAAGKLAVPASSDLTLTNRDDAIQDSRGTGKFLRRLLRMIVTEPTEMRAPRQAIRQLRPFADRARLALQAISQAGIEDMRGHARLVDGAVAGLCHVARFCADDFGDSMVPLFAAAGVELRGASQSDATVLALLFVVPENAAARQHADRMIAFVVSGLCDLGFALKHASCTPHSAPALVDLFPDPALTLSDIHFVWGCFSLYADFARRLPAAAGERHIHRT